MCQLLGPRWLTASRLNRLTWQRDNQLPGAWFKYRMQPSEDTAGFAGYNSGRRARQRMRDVGHASQTQTRQASCNESRKPNAELNDTIEGRSNNSLNRTRELACLSSATCS